MKFLSVTILLFVFAGVSTKAQTTTTNTNCNTAGSTSVNCTSTSTTAPDTSAQMNQAGQQMGAALGVLIARKRAVKAAEDHAAFNIVYCTQNPSGSVVNGYGQTQDCAKEYAVTQANCTLHPKEKFCKLLPAFTASREPATAQPTSASAK